ncbi:MAG TPA: outer membrane beta-barrel family protein [Puia sp.]|nr:outer membrane beta-barrel family protein [Puia sp.]
MSGFLQKGMVLALFLSLSILVSYGQVTLSGRVVDTIGHKHIPFAVIACLRQTDSMLLNFTRTAADGHFSLRLADHGSGGSLSPSGGFILLITHPEFANQFFPVKIAGTAPVDLGSIPLPPRSNELVAAVVTQRRPVIRIKGDSLEYDASSVKVKTNGSVEDLLRLLPGVEVNQKGEIMAQGQKIQKVLIDGEEFFSDDPTIATRNLSASMIDKVQVINKKSPQSEFTGIDDGKSVHTLNLTLREDKKNGYFLKAEAGTGDKYYNNSGLAGAFKARRKLSVFGMASSTGQSGLSGADAQSFDDGENTYIPQGPGGADNFGASGATGGTPLTSNAGVHYSNKWNGDGIHDGQHLSGNYRYNRIFNDPVSTTITRQTLADTIYLQTQQATSRSSKDQHTLSAIYEITFDSSSSFRLSFGGLTEQAHNQDGFTGSTLLNDTLVNDSHRSSDADIDNRNFIGNILWRKKFAHPGQTLSAYANIHTTDNHVSGYLYSVNNFRQPDTSLISHDTTDQKKDNTGKATTIEGNILYTTPVWKDWVIAAGYSLALTHNESIRNTFNKGGGKYDDYIDSLSSAYGFNIATQRVRLTAQLKKQHFTYTLGGDMSYAAYRQTDLLQDTSIRYHYLNFFPHMEARYNFSSFRSISFNYYGSTQQPSIYQLQPAKNNNDPLNIVLGNPGLQPAFSHSFRLGLNDYKPLAGRYLYIGVGYGFTSNSISSSTQTDALGRNLSQAVNVNGNQNAQLYGSSTWKLRSLDLNLGLNSSVSYNRTINFVNTRRDSSDTWSPGGGVNIGRNVPDKYNFFISSNWNYAYSHSSVNPAALTSYWTGVYSAQLGITLPWQIEWNTNCEYSWRQKINGADKELRVARWNAWLDKRFFRNALTARLLVNDILDQNTGFTRNLSANQLTETSFTSLRRYWMLSIIWNFVNRGKAGS